MASLVGLLDHDNRGRWRDARGRLRTRPGDYEVELNLANLTERSAFLMGYYPDVATHLALDAAIRPGGQVLDVGANLGWFTLRAAYRVGPGGVVHSFEPHPVALERLRSHVDRNDLAGHVTVHPVGLSDRSGDSTIQVLGGDVESATLGDLPADMQASVTGAFPVRLARGDDLLAGRLDPARGTFLKLDVEGHELQALIGLEGTIAATRPVIAAEMLANRLAACGASPAALFEFFEARNYRGFLLETRRRGLGHALVLTPLTKPADVGEHADTLWLPHEQPPPPGLVSQLNRAWP